MGKQANMRIKCSTERAFDHTIAVLNFVGSGEYAVDKESKVIELSVNSWDWCRLIDIIHFQFKEELGERAWRKEIDFYIPHENQEDEKFNKDPEEVKPKKRVMHLVFGEYACKRIPECTFPDDEDGDDGLDDTLEEVLDCMRNFDATYVVREYNTEAEEKAYLDALSDLDGWTGYTILEDSLCGEDIEKFDKMMDEIGKEEEDASSDETSRDDYLKYLDCEAYHVETDKEGKKHIHIDGYCYVNENEHDDGYDYRCVEGTWCYVSVEELDACNDDDQKLELLQKAFDETKQYEGDMTEDEVREYYKDATELRMEKVTQDTPDGWYVHY